MSWATRPAALGRARSLGVDAADAPVGVRRAERRRDVAEVLARGLLRQLAGTVPEVVGERRGDPGGDGRSLSVSGYRSNSSNSGGSGDPDASHSARHDALDGVQDRRRVGSL